MDTLLEAVALGLLGGVHCIGMCGVFGAAVGSACRGAARLRFAGRMGAYLAGKTLTYVFLGTAAAALGDRWLEPAHLHAWRRVALWLAAATILGTGLRLGGWLPSFDLGLRDSVVARAVLSPLRALRRAMQLPGASGAAILGFLNGFLPCGLVYAAVLLAAASKDPLHGAGVMAAFGVATGPALLLPALAGRQLAASRAMLLRRVAALLLLVLAAGTAWRGARWLPGEPSCCSAEGATEQANLRLVPTERGFNPSASPGLSPTQRESNS